MQGASIDTNYADASPVPVAGCGSGRHERPLRFRFPPRTVFVT